MLLSSLAFPRSALAALAVVALATVAAGPAWADDRDLLRQGATDPYVFILLDVSGSMNESIPCTAEDAAAGNCDLVCPPGACLPRLISDDPASRMVVAKEAIYEIMQRTEGVNFGFGSFDQDGLRVFRKHWWYSLDMAASRLVGASPITLDSGRAYPGPGHESLFGETWDCTQGRGRSRNIEPERFIGCSPDQPADLADPWEEERVRRYPKLDDDNDTDRTYYIRDTDDTVYQVSFFALDSGAFSSQELGDDTLRVRVRVRRCDNSDCTNRTLKGDDDFVFANAGAMVYWEPVDSPSRTAPNVGFFGAQGGVRQSTQDRHDTGLELNTDTRDDEYSVENLMTRTVADPYASQFPRSRGGAYTVGDLVPFDWLDDQRETIQRRMAPNLALGETDPDFGIARYLEDHPRSGEPVLRLLDDRAAPLIPYDITPTGRSMEEFRKWFDDWLTTATDDEIGDPNLACRNFNLVIVTDGLASDGLSACGHANQLRNHPFRGSRYPVRSFVVALGNPELDDPNFSNVLDCIADNGGSGETDHDGDGEPDGPGPLFPQNKNQLIDAFQEIFELINTQNRSFASAAVPQAQASAEDKIFLTNFTPVPGAARWAGRLDAYLRPVPLTPITVSLPDGTSETRLVPDRGRVCDTGDTAACRLWDGGEELLDQAATADQVAAGDFNLGNGRDQRRVYYARLQGLATPEARRDLEAPGDDAGWQDLLLGMGICEITDPDLALCARNAAHRAEALDVLRFAHRVETFQDPDTAELRSYLLGDVFHSNPQVVGQPASLQYFTVDLFGERDCGYRCFFEKHRLRRNVLMTGSNDGQLHAFDVGIYRTDDEAYDNGTGRELFAYVPRPVLPTLREMADPSDHQHRYNVDGTPVAGDVYIDPAWVVSPDPDDREWRSVVVGGLREGGSGYYALDVTQPDEIDADGVPLPRGGADTGVVPSCLAGGADCGPVPYPSVLWEFTADFGCSASVGAACDDDMDGLADLGDTWSQPALGFVEVCSNDPCTDDDGVVRTELRSVAIFGGGLDPERKRQAEQSGDHLYMVDVESGRVLYKRPLQGASPGTPAAIDADQDGVFDTLYLGTTLGKVYKVDLTEPVPAPVMPGIGPRVLDDAWDPYVIFDTGGRPLFFPPAVIFLAARNQFALAVGTGDREDLWEQAPNDDGRFYVFVDNSLTADSVGLPYDEGDLAEISVGGAPLASDADFLITSNAALPGWFFRLRDDERVIGRAFSLGGITAFSTFQPSIDERPGPGGDTVVCARTGISRLFGVSTVNANPVLTTTDRFRVVNDFVTEFFSEMGAIKNDLTGVEGPTSDDVPESLENVIAALKKLYPDECRFANYTINVKALRSDTGVEFVAPVPICIVQRNWRQR